MENLFGQLFALFILVIGFSWLIGGKPLAGRAAAWPFEFLGRILWEVLAFCGRTMGWIMTELIRAAGLAVGRFISDIYNHFFPPRPRGRRR